MIAESYVPTTTAAKYLKWLCGHFKIKVPAQYDDHQGSIDFGFGHCQMQADSEALHIRVEADTTEALSRVKDVVGGHLERFAHKESVHVTWQDQA